MNWAHMKDRANLLVTCAAASLAAWLFWSQLGNWGFVVLAGWGVYESFLLRREAE